MSDSKPPALSADELVAFRKRARRRLVGAIFLAAVAAIVLPWVMDADPPAPDHAVTLRIAGKDSTPLPTYPLPEEAATNSNPPAISVAPPTEKRASVYPASKPATPSAQSKPAASSAPVQENVASSALQPKPQTKAQPDNPPPKTEPATGAPPSPAPPSPATAYSAWLVQFGVYADKANAQRLVKALKAQSLPAYLEAQTTTKGLRHRVRVGPFDSKVAADRARAKAKMAGLDGTVIAP
jgi:DedD protein